MSPTEKKKCSPDSLNALIRVMIFKLCILTIRNNARNKYNYRLAKQHSGLEKKKKSHLNLNRAELSSRGDWITFLKQQQQQQQQFIDLYGAVIASACSGWLPRNWGLAKAWLLGHSQTAGREREAPHPLTSCQAAGRRTPVPPSALVTTELQTLTWLKMRLKRCYVHRGYRSWLTHDAQYFILLRIFISEVPALAPYHLISYHITSTVGSSL